MKPIIFVSILAFCALVLLVEHAQERADSFLYLQTDDMSLSIDDLARFGVIPAKKLGQVSIDKPKIIYLGVTSCGIYRTRYPGKLFFNKHHEDVWFRCGDGSPTAEEEHHFIGDVPLECMNSWLFDTLVELDSLLRRLGFVDLPWPIPQTSFLFSQ